MHPRFELNIKEPKKKFDPLPLIILLFVFLTGLYITRQNLLHTLIGTALIIAISLLANILAPSHFITQIIMDKDLITVTYLAKGRSKILSGRQKDFMFTRHTSRRKYLEIRYRSRTVIRQDISDEWTIELMDQLCREARKKRA